MINVKMEMYNHDDFFTPKFEGTIARIKNKLYSYRDGKWGCLDE